MSHGGGGSNGRVEPAYSVLNVNRTVSFKRLNSSYKHLSIFKS